jgi:hypothetical protein
MCSLLYFCVFHCYILVIFIPSCRSENNLDQWYQSSLLLVISQSRSSTRSSYIDLDLEVASLKDNHSRYLKGPSMVEEKRYDRVGYPFNMFLKESLV